MKNIKSTIQWVKGNDAEAIRNVLFKRWVR